MELGGTGSIYRLVVDFARREAIGDRPFRSRKRAVGRVSALVHAHADSDEIVAVRLERADIRIISSNGDGKRTSVPGIPWRTVERWNGDVVRRILWQRARWNGAHSPDVRSSVEAPRKLLPTTSSETTASAAQSPLSILGGPDQQRTRAASIGRSHRWHTTAMLTLAALVWVALALLLAGGHLSILLERGGRPPAMATELPFDVPALGGAPEGSPITAPTAAQSSVPAEEFSLIP